MDVYVVHMLFVTLMRELISKKYGVIEKNFIAFAMTIIIVIGTYYGSRFVLRKFKLYRISIGI